MSIINEALIQSLLSRDRYRDPGLQREIIEKAGARELLSPEDVAILLAVDSPELREEIHQQAKIVKQEIYGNRLVLFAPMYLTNRCINNCLYCSFRRENTELVRATLTQDEIRREVEYLLDQGHKRLLVVAGEHPREASLEYIGTSINTIYNTRRGGNNIRRVNINAAPMDVDDFRTLKSFGIGTYQCFQETYHRESYGVVHPSGTKHDYEWRLSVMDRAMEAGVDDVGVGVLFGLYDYRFEVLAMLQHVHHLEQNFGGVGPHTISVPRLEPARNAPLDSTNAPWTVNDEDFKTLIAIIRLAVPYTGMILSTRENPEIRRTLFDYGISQISAGSKTDPGGYQHGDHDLAQQFQLGDHRCVDEVIRDVVSLGYLPSFCTACYRSGRTGDRFMDLAKSGTIGKICAPNALATFQEYLNDYAEDVTKEVAEPLIDSELEKLPEAVRKNTKEMLDRIDDGERDVYL